MLDSFPTTKGSHSAEFFHNTRGSRSRKFREKEAEEIEEELKQKPNEKFRSKEVLSIFFSKIQQKRGTMAA